MTVLFNDDSKPILKKLTEHITAFIEADKFNHPDTIQAYVDGTVAFLEKLAIQQYERAFDMKHSSPMQTRLVEGLTQGVPQCKYPGKMENLSEAILRFHKFIVEKNKAESVQNIKSIDLIKLHCSLDNLIIEDEKLSGSIQEIKNALPLSDTERLVLNSYSQNPNTRASAIERLFEAYDQNPDCQIYIIRSLFKMLDDKEIPKFDDNKEMSTNIKPYNPSIGRRAFEKIDILISKIPNDDFEKIQAVVNELANYIKNPGVINWSIAQENENRWMLFSVTNTVLMSLLSICYSVIPKSKIDLEQLNRNLKTFYDSIPDYNYVLINKDNIKRAIDRINEWQPSSESIENSH